MERRVSLAGVIVARLTYVFRWEGGVTRSREEREDEGKPQISQMGSRSVGF